MLKQTALTSWHLENNAKMLGFAGYNMPIQYSGGVIKEHETVRKNIGLFDVSHMGLVRVEGENSAQLLNKIVTKDIKKIPLNRAAYTMMCNAEGGIIDDLIVYRSGDTEFYLVLNAGNKDSDLTHILAADENHQLRISTLFDEVCILALQGPKAPQLLRDLGLKTEHKAFDFISQELAGVPTQIAFTGYTGEAGCEIFVGKQYALGLWKTLLEVGAPYDIQACGLAARDSLRLEMGYSLHGQDITPKISPVEAGLKWAVDFKKENFLGKSILDEHKVNPPRKWVGLKNNSKQAPRTGMAIFDNADKAVGEITSGTFAPSLGHAIGMGLVAANAEGPFTVEIRNKKVPFETTKRPFYKKEESK